jgi:uncharacterized YccA/Bax inhibitor family protein
MPTSNPALSTGAFRRIYATEVGAGTMTMTGTLQKTGILFGLLLSTALFMWYLIWAEGANSSLPWLLMMGGFVGGLVVAFLTIFRPKFAPYTAPLYALLEGLAIGGISVFMEAYYPGIVLPAIGLTFGVMAMMLAVYASGLIKVTDKFRFGITAAIGGIMIVYVVTILLGFFGVYVPYVFSGGGAFGIAFSLFVVGIASLSLLLDFDQIERGAASHMPKFAEWYAAFSLMITLVWLYLEILRLLGRTRQ